MSILDEIVGRKREEVAALGRRPADGASLAWAVKACGPRRDFAMGLRHPAWGRPALIAEVKKASPSAGVIRADFDPVRLACEYEAAGAACISVLTDGPFFQGSLEDLARVRAAVRLPLLRKDFLLEERQVLESVEWGADAVLLIAAILDEGRLESMLRLAEGVGLAALVEVHDEGELERALRVGARLVGVNNRDLRTFRTDLGTTERLAGRLGAAGARGEVLLVAESGIQTRGDAERVARAGAHGMLVGEALMRSAEVGARVRELLGV